VGAQSDIVRHRKAIQDLERKIAEESKKVAAARGKSSKAVQAAQRSKSKSVIDSKHREAQREEEKANRAETTRATLENKRAAEQVKLHSAEAKFAKEQERTQDATIKQLRQVIEQNAAQFKPSFARAPIGSADDKTYELFISHASEDKHFATPLADALQNAGLRVWFDEFEIRVGDSIRRKIDEGLVKSKMGVVILSNHFFAKEWPQAELDGLIAKLPETEEFTILPI
jgi:hypothetical protein